MKSKKQIIQDVLEFKEGQRIFLRKRAPEHTPADEKEKIKQALRETKEKFGDGPFFVRVTLDVFGHEIENVGHPQKLLISKIKKGPFLKNDQNKPEQFSGVLFKKTK